MRDRVDAGSRQGISVSLWRSYAAMVHKARGWPFWRWGVAGWDLGLLVDTAVRNLLPPLPRREVDVSLFGGGTITLPPGYEDFGDYQSGVYWPPTERATTRIITERLGTGMGMVDGGAHLGYYSLTASKAVGSSGHVYAFEPEPQIFSYLSRNLQRNGCENVSAEPLAISDRSGESTFFSRPARGTSSLYARHQAHTQTMAVKTVSLDEYFAARGWPRIDVVKLDIEGAEKVALMGMAQLVQRNPGMSLILEVALRAQPSATTTGEELLGLARDLGFRRFFILGEGVEELQVPGGVRALQSKAKGSLWRNVLCETGKTRIGERN